MVPSLGWKQDLNQTLCLSVAANHRHTSTLTNFKPHHLSKVVWLPHWKETHYYKQPTTLITRLSLTYGTQSLHINKIIRFRLQHRHLWRHTRTPFSHPSHHSLTSSNHQGTNWSTAICRLSQNSHGSEDIQATTEVASITTVRISYAPTHSWTWIITTAFINCNCKFNIVK